VNRTDGDLVDALPFGAQKRVRRRDRRRFQLAMSADCLQPGMTFGYQAPPLVDLAFEQVRLRPDRRDRGPAGGAGEIERRGGQSGARGIGRHHEEAIAGPVAEGKQRDQPLLLRSEEHTSELQSPCNLVCRLLLEKKKKKKKT